MWVYFSGRAFGTEFSIVYALRIHRVNDAARRRVINCRRRTLSPSTGPGSTAGGHVLCSVVRRTAAAAVVAGVAMEKTRKRVVVVVVTERQTTTRPYARTRTHERIIAVYHTGRFLLRAIFICIAVENRRRPVFVRNGERKWLLCPDDGSA